MRNIFDWSRTVRGPAYGIEDTKNSFSLGLKCLEAECLYWYLPLAQFKGAPACLYAYIEGMTDLQIQGDVFKWALNCGAQFSVQESTFDGLRGLRMKADGFVGDCVLEIPEDLAINIKTVQESSLVSLHVSLSDYRHQFWAPCSKTKSMLWTIILMQIAKARIFRPQLLKSHISNLTASVPNLLVQSIICPSLDCKKVHV